MRLSQSRIISQGKHTILWARLELSTRVDNFPEYLWYRVPNRYATYLSTLSDAFLTPVLPVAMHFGEDLEISGSVSARLAYNLDEYQYILSYLFPDQVRKVAIHYQQTPQASGANPESKPFAIGAAFSGGVDSWFTLQKHLPENQPNPDYQISHALFIFGFDITRRGGHKYDELLARFRKVLSKINIELVPIQTNIISLLVPRLNFPDFYGPSLAGCGLALSGLFKRYFISNSRDHYQLKQYPHVSNPLTDRLLSSDSMEIEHFGAAYRRVEKIAALSGWRLAQEHLRVCAQPGLSRGVLNCSRCGKCIRTMLPLYALGELENFTTFPKPLHADSAVMRWARKFDSNPMYISETLAFVRKYRPDMMRWLTIAVSLGLLRYWLFALVPDSIKAWLGQFGFFTGPFKEKNAFESFEVLKAIESQDNLRFTAQLEDRIKGIL